MTLRNSYAWTCASWPFWVPSCWRWCCHCIFSSTKNLEIIWIGWVAWILAMCQEILGYKRLGFGSNVRNIMWWYCWSTVSLEKCMGSQFRMRKVPLETLLLLGIFGWACCFLFGSETTLEAPKRDGSNSLHTSPPLLTAGGFDMIWPLKLGQVKSSRDEKERERERESVGFWVYIQYHKLGSFLLQLMHYKKSQGEKKMNCQLYPGCLGVPRLLGQIRSLVLTIHIIDISYMIHIHSHCISYLDTHLSRHLYLYSMYIHICTSI